MHDHYVGRLIMIIQRLGCRSIANMIDGIVIRHKTLWFVGGNKTCSWIKFRKKSVNKANSNLITASMWEPCELFKKKKKDVHCHWIGSESVKRNYSRCNIPVDFVARRVTETAREQERLRPHTLQKLQRWSTDCYSVKAEKWHRQRYYHELLLTLTTKNSFCSKLRNGADRKCSTSSLHKCKNNNNNNNSLTPTLTLREILHLDTWCISSRFFLLIELRSCEGD